MSRADGGGVDELIDSSRPIGTYALVAVQSCYVPPETYNRPQLVGSSSCRRSQGINGVRYASQVDRYRRISDRVENVGILLTRDGRFSTAQKIV